MWKHVSIYAALLWAGLSLGGNLIAAPAKFQVQNIATETLLQIGRAQFDWLNTAQWPFLAMVLLSAVLTGRLALALFSVPVLIFVYQQLVVMPALDERTVRIIAGETLPGSSLHIVFVVLEVSKFLLLIAAVIIVMKRYRQVPVVPA